MTLMRLLLQSLVYYWRTNIAVLLGVIAGTAVIGGALVVGDSVRDSLRQMSLDRLGGIDHVLRGERFFREQLADELATQPKWKQRFSAVAPALVMTGSLERSANEQTRRANKVTVYGVDDRLWRLTDHGSVTAPVERYRRLRIASGAPGLRRGHGRLHRFATVRRFDGRRDRRHHGRARL